jgi:DNA-binding FrmR family transcriptional regulator
MTTIAPPERSTPAGADRRGTHEGGTAMELDPVEMSKVVNRLKRAQGQLAGVVRMLEDGRECEDVVTQLSAVSKALDRAGFAIIASGMKQCLTEPDNSSTLDVDKLQKLFLSLA